MRVKKALQKYDNFKENTLANVKAINQLINQSEKLKKIISEIEGDENRELKNKLTELRENLLCSVEQLAVSLDDLFKNCEKILDILS